MCEIEIKVIDGHRCIDKIRIKCSKLELNKNYGDTTSAFLDKKKSILIVPSDFGKRIGKYLENGRS